MSMRRFTRLTNAFSKKVENLAAAVAIHFMHYNFCRPHMSLKRRTPAQAASVTSRRWTALDMVRLGRGGKSKGLKLAHYPARLVLKKLPMFR
jgi:hypothetical protein